MASNKKKNASAPSHNTFAETIFKIAYRFSLVKVFDDFLTMSIAACTQNLKTGKSYYEDEYLEIIAHYKDSDLRHEFPKAFAQLVVEMEERVHSDTGNDVLGEFFEAHISHGSKSQFFTPFPICTFMATATRDAQSDEMKEKKPLRILDPACGSGRMLLAAHKVYGAGHEYYGIDIDRTCVKMAALNLFLHGMWHSEVMCADALRPDDFVITYHISLLPLGIFKIEAKEKSMLWHLHKNSFEKNTKEPKGADIELDPTPFSERKQSDGTQLDLF